METLLGFDARRAFDPALWQRERRQRYLLLPDVKVVLSVDDLVWPRLEGVEAPPPPTLSEDFGSLVGRVSDVGEPATIIAVTLVGDVSGSGTADHSSVWPLLGFDVADHGRLSGLSNCGYDSLTVDVWRARWGPLLNDSHLFDNRKAADEFRAVTDARVDEHAPFLVYGLYFAGGSHPAGDP